MGALEPGEAAACEAHLGEPIAHPGGIEAVARARATVGRPADALPPVRPGERVWQGIAERIGPEAAPTARRMVRETVAWALLAAAGVALYLTGAARIDAAFALGTLRAELIDDQPGLPGERTRPR